MEGKPVAEQDIGRQLLQETEAYAESSVCRRKMLLHYFGEEYPKDNCCMCDNCLHPKKKIEAMNQLLIVLQAVKALKENFRQEYVIDFVKVGRQMIKKIISITSLMTSELAKMKTRRYGTL